jgi:hypothetical protein
MYPQWLPNVLRKAIFLAISAASWLKWTLDRRSLPLTEADWQLYLDIHVVSAIRLKRLPNLLRPRGFNDQMKWLMLFGQDELMPECVDKLQARKVVSDKIGPQHLIPLRAAGSWADVLPALKSGSGVLKCTHDSGSAVLFDSLSPDDIDKLEGRFHALLSKEHGVGKGEWHYGRFRPQLLVEERLPGSRPDCGPTDIKVHCVNGEPRLIHFIDGRQARDQSQAFFLPNGKRIQVAVKPDREQMREFDATRALQFVLPPAKKLAGNFRYVRTDFYLVEDKVFFGELSFHEQAGLFQSRREEQDLGRVLRISCDNPSPTLRSRAIV